MVLAGCPCWSSGWWECCVDSHVFALCRMVLPLQGARLSNLLQFARCGFFPLNSFHAALEDENEVVAFQSLAPKLRLQGSFLSAPSGKSSPLLLSLLSRITLCAHLPCNWVFVSHAWDHVPGLLCCAPVLLLLREEGFFHKFFCLLGPCLENSHPTMLWFKVYDNPELRAQSWACWLQLASWLWWLGSLPHSCTPGLPGTPGILTPHCPL